MCWFGRFQKFLASVFEDDFSKVVTIEEIDQFFGAENLDQQKTLFDKLPLEKMKVMH